MESSVPRQNMHPRFSSMRNVFPILMNSQKYLKALAEHNQTVYNLSKNLALETNIYVMFITHDFKISELG